MQNLSEGLVVLNTVPPDAGAVGAYLFEGAGTSKYHQFDVIAQVRLREDREMFFSYVRSRARGDLNEFGSFLGSVPSAIIRENRYGTLSTDLPNRFLAWGVLRATKTLQFAPMIEYRNGFPYLETDVHQDYAGAPYRNRYPVFASIDTRVSKDVKINSSYSVRVSVTGFNLTNHFNPEAVHANTGDPAYGYFFGHRGRRFTADLDFLF